jgi:hypothetical protein
MVLANPIYICLPAVGLDAAAGGGDEGLSGAKKGEGGGAADLQARCANTHTHTHTHRQGWRPTFV